MLLFLLPALVQNAAPNPVPIPEREITFPGFNGFQLKGSVLGTGQGAWFSVMVAGAGPCDRNWFNPVLKDPRTNAVLQSHAGRDLARWLQEQGIGSLRFDKRIIGTRDPALDVSLDAQMGDLRAALAAARQLPEAKGRKLLLVGHDEGALLALMAAGDADALLLLGMPAGSQASVIRHQIEALVPAAQAKADLAYLDQIFEAIRQRQPTPSPGEGVHPFMGSMGKSLMAPETLDFVRSLLDIDPWVLAARLALPTAIVWGDRDIQTPRPMKVPPSFRGAVIELESTNHLLKRETRLKSTLKPAVAIGAYGDDTPLAELNPLERWLKSLR
jgi:pimeloyl-ACP methyl ester carboxylesterase